MSQNQESLVSFSLTLSAFLLMLWILFTCLAANIIHHATKHSHEARAEKLIEEKWILTNAVKKIAQVLG